MKKDWRRRNINERTFNNLSAPEHKDIKKQQDIPKQKEEDKEREPWEGVT